MNISVEKHLRIFKTGGVSIAQGVARKKKICWMPSVIFLSDLLFLFLEDLSVLSCFSHFGSAMGCNPENF